MTCKKGDIVDILLVHREAVRWCSAIDESLYLAVVRGIRDLDEGLPLFSQYSRVIYPFIFSNQTPAESHEDFLGSLVPEFIGPQPQAPSACSSTKPRGELSAQLL